jgi:hypothetical protein
MLSSMVARQNVAQAADMRHVLPDHSIYQAPSTQLQFGVVQIVSAGAQSQAGRDFRSVMWRPDLMLVILAVPQVLRCPVAAALIQIGAGAGELRLIKVLCHLFHRAQRAQIPTLHLRIGAEVFDIHGVVLAAFHHAVAVTVPAAFDPAELQSAFGVRPQTPQPLVIAAQLPITIQLHQTAHLPIGGGDAFVPAFRSAVVAAEGQ